MKNKIAKFLLLFSIVLLTNSCARIRFETKGIIIETSLGEFGTLVIFNPDNVDFEEESTLDIIWGGIAVAGKDGKNVREIKFTEDPAHNDFKNTDPMDEIKLVLYSEFDPVDFDFSIFNEIGHISSTDLKAGGWYFWDLDKETLEYLGKIKKVQEDYKKEEEEKNKNSGGGGGSGGGSGGGVVGSYDYTFVCPITQESHTVPIPKDGCETKNEYYARTFVCNDVAKMYDACVDYLRCNKKEPISFCDVYK